MPISLAKQFSKLLKKDVVIRGNSIKFKDNDKPIAKFRLAGLPSCCGATVLYGFRLFGRSKDGKVEQLVCRVIEQNAGRSWSYIETTTQNKNKVAAFEAAGWTLKAKFENRAGITYQYQKNLIRTRSTENDDW